jgi:hypothetical protein
MTPAGLGRAGTSDVIAVTMEERLAKLDHAHGNRLRRRMDRMLNQALLAYADNDAAADAAHLRKTLAGLALETSAVRMGFILGYEAGCNQKKDGAR